MSVALSVVAIALALPCEANRTEDFLNHLEISAREGSDVQGNILSPALDASQIEQLSAIKSCYFVASYASSDDRILWTWVCPEKSQNINMQVIASYGQVQRVILDGREVWSNAENENG